MGFTKAAFWLGVASSAFSVVLYVVMKIMSSWALSRSSGERNLRMAAIAIIFGAPILFCAAAGVLSLLASAASFAWQRTFRRDKSGQPSRTAS
jgi:hypothetical protein